MNQHIDWCVWCFSNLGAAIGYCTFKTRQLFTGQWAMFTCYMTSLSKSHNRMQAMHCHALWHMYVVLSTRVPLCCEVPH